MRVKEAAHKLDHKIELGGEKRHMSIRHLAFA